MVENQRKKKRYSVTQHKTLLNLVLSMVYYSVIADIIPVQN